MGGEREREAELAAKEDQELVPIGSQKHFFFGKQVEFRSEN